MKHKFGRRLYASIMANVEKAVGDALIEHRASLGSITAEDAHDILDEVVGDALTDIAIAISDELPDLATELARTSQQEDMDDEDMDEEDEESMDEGKKKGKKKKAQTDEEDMDEEDMDEEDMDEEDEEDMDDEDMDEGKKKGKKKKAQTDEDDEDDDLEEGMRPGVNTHKKKKKKAKVDVDEIDAIVADLATSKKDLLSISDRIATNDIDTAARLRVLAEKL